MKNQQDKPVAIRISVVTDNRSISHSEWLQYNDKFKDLGIVFEISDNGYPSMAMIIKVSMQYTYTNQKHT